MPGGRAGGSAFPGTGSSLGLCVGLGVGFGMGLDPASPGIPCLSSAAPDAALVETAAGLGGAAGEGRVDVSGLEPGLGGGAFLAAACRSEDTDLLARWVGLGGGDWRAFCRCCSRVARAAASFCRRSARSWRCSGERGAAPPPAPPTPDRWMPCGDEAGTVWLEPYGCSAMRRVGECLKGPSRGGVLAFAAGLGLPSCPAWAGRPTAEPAGLWPRAV